MSSSVSSIALRATAAIAAFGMNMLVARLLTVEEFGVFALGLTRLVLAPAVA
jgi:O-antigen/teichoic acid export membrane protein